MALLDAQCGEGFEPVRLDAKRCSSGEDVLPQRHAVIGRRIDFVSELAGKTKADEAHRHAFDLGFEHAHIGQLRVGKIGAGERKPQRLARLRARDGHAGPFIGQRADLDLQIGPDRLQQEFEP